MDKRSDIWAFGVVVWEMATGERLFSGETVSDTLAAVLTREIDVTALPASMPPALRHLVQRCLERDPKRRLRDIGEARLLLDDPSSASIMLESMALPGSVAPKRTRASLLTSLLPWILLIVLLILGLPRILDGGGGASGEARVRRFEIAADLPSLYNTRAVEIAPDGRSIAIYDRDGLWVRRLDQTRPRLLVEAKALVYNEVGITPFWSPDSQEIAYAANGRLWKIPADGGEPSVVCTLPGGWSGGAWGSDGTIVLCSSRGPMYSVPARGGDAELLIPLVEGVELDFHQPFHVSDGGGFVYSVHRAEGVDTIELYRDGTRTILLRVQENLRGSVQLLNNPVYCSTGHIIYQRDQGNRGLWALPFDAEKGEASGPPFLVLSEAGHPSVSRDGTLIHTPLSEAASGKVVVASRDGEITEILTEQLLGVANPEFSPDGRSIAYTATYERSSDVLVMDRDTRIMTRLTLSSENESNPSWIPGSDRIAYMAPYDGGCVGIWAINADGSGEPEFLVEDSADPTFGPDGLDLVCTTRCNKERGLIHHRLDGSQAPVILRDHPAGIDKAQISPDGRHIAYITWESGLPSLEVAQFPSMSGRRLITRTESVLRWSRDGREIYYIAQEPARLVVATLEPGDTFTIQATAVLFELGPLGIAPFADFDVVADGSEFAFVMLSQDGSGIRAFTVVENWYEEFREN